jgi:tubulin monoglycylase TTLL3/8
VTDWNPLTVWLYKEPYFRFPATDYDPNNIADRFIHLTNNSVAKYAEGAKISYEIPGNMWCFEEFSNHMQEEYGWDVWEDKLKEQMKSIVINSLESVQDMFECKPGCFELFGFDMMIDDEFNMWLIEVNSSPAMDYSTDVTERLVKLVLEDTVKVVVDYS